MAGKSRIPMETQQAIASEYSAGARTGDLALKYSLNRKSILDIAKRHGCAMRHQHYMSGRKKMDTYALHGEVTKLRLSGLSQQKIGGIVGVSQAVVGRILAKCGLSRRETLRKERHGSWKGGRVTTSGGYIAIQDGEFESMCDSSGYTLEHRLTMARNLGRALTKGETVHHINGNRQDNRLENLQLRSGQHGAGVVLRCRCCGGSDIESTRIAD